MATSTKTEDYMGRALINASPGVTNPVKDYMGRVTSSTADYNGVVLLDDLASSLAGFVTDSAGAVPIEGATVSTSGRSGTTDSDGAYTLTGLPSGIYTVTASADGYYTSTVEGVVVDSNEDVTDIRVQLVATP